MNKEANSSKVVVDDFLKEFGIEKLEFGSDNYRAVKEALEIGRMYQLKYELGDGLSRVEKLAIQLHKDRVVQANKDSCEFVEKFIHLCDWVVADLGYLPAVRIYRKIELLTDKIKEVDERVDLV